MLSKIDIHHNWNKKNTNLIGEIRTKFITFYVELSVCKNSTHNLIQLDGTLKEKIRILPNHTIDILLEQFGGIFQHIIKTFKHFHDDL